MLTYNFNNVTTVGDPGAGDLRFNNADAGATSIIVLDDLDALGVDVTNILAALDDANSYFKGILTISEAYVPAN